MNASRTITSLVAAAAIVGSVGFAYAQTTTNPSSPATTPTTEVAPAPMAPAPMAPAQDTMSTPKTSPAAADGSMNSEMAPKADRN